MLTAALALYLLGLGPLVLFGLWRVERHRQRATMERRLQARRLARMTRLLVASAKHVRAFREELRATRDRGAREVPKR